MTINRIFFYLLRRKVGQNETSEHAHLFEGPMPKTISGSKSNRDINILAAIFCSDPSDVFIKHFDKDI